MVEDEPLVALDIVAALEGVGAEVVGSAGTAKEALSLIDDTSLDAALLDANLRGHPVDEIAAALAARNIPFLFVTGYGPGEACRRLSPRPPCSPSPSARSNWSRPWRRSWKHLRPYFV